MVLPHVDVGCCLLVFSLGFRYAPLLLNLFSPSLFYRFR